MKTVAIIQARMGSTRFPGKVMKKLGGTPVLGWVVEAAAMASGIDKVVVATSTLPADDVIAAYANDGYHLFRGSEDDVLDRVYQCAKHFNADNIVRLTADCPFLDSRVIGEVVHLRNMTGADYASNIDPPSYPDGLDVECISFRALECAWREAVRSTDRDAFPQFIVRNRHRFRAANLRCPLPGLEKERWVLDTEDDWKFCEEIADRLKGDPSYLNILDILNVVPELRDINELWGRNERFYEHLATEKLPERSFKESRRLLERARRTIPFGAQTFSKSHIQFPAGKAPLYCTHADGARIFDVDGNDYIDLVNAVLPVVLGYRDPDVDAAIRQQLDRGISFSLATELEAELSELLCKHIPCAEMVKFGKTGTDVTTAAVRLARAYTRREHVLVGGYHGWADWSMAVTDRCVGIPLTVQDLSYRFRPGHIPIPPANVAAIIVEPNERDGLPQLKEYCEDHGIVLIFDEIITGFRYDIGGAQHLFNVTPDLACFGKAMANGMPISALVGKKEIMRLMEPPGNIFYSGTMFGETLSIAAAIATINKLEREMVIPAIWNAGVLLRSNISRGILESGLEDAVSVTGMYPRLMLNFKDVDGATANQLRTLFMAEMAQGGVLIINSNNLSYAHKSPELTRIISAYERTFGIMAESLHKRDIEKRVGNSIVEAAPLRLVS